MQAAEAVKFTCLACRVGWASLEQQRAHYRTDWHRYNLKRKVWRFARLRQASIDIQPTDRHFIMAGRGHGARDGGGIPHPRPDAEEPC